MPSLENHDPFQRLSPLLENSQDSHFVKLVQTWSAAGTFRLGRNPRFKHMASGLVH